MIGKKSFRPRAKVLLVHRSAIGDFDKVRWRFPWLELIWADGGYNAWQVDAAVAKVPLLRMEIVKRSDEMKGASLERAATAKLRRFPPFPRRRSVGPNRPTTAARSISLHRRVRCDPDFVSPQPNIG